MILAIIIIVLILGAVAFIAGRKIEQKTLTEELKRKKEDAQTIISEAEKKGELILKDAELKARDILIEIKTNAEKEITERKKELSSLEQRLRKKEENLEKRGEYVTHREREIEKKIREIEIREAKLQGKEKHIEEQQKKYEEKLQEVSRMTREEAREFLINRIKEEIKSDIAKMIAEAERKAKEESQIKVQKILSLSIQRQASEFVYDNSVTVVPLPSDDMKGRIIGREGRNIRAFESSSGVDIIVDDTPEAVVISSLNPMRREVAKRALEKLIADGRIHPGRIEEVVTKAEKEVDQYVKDAGEKAVMDLNIGEVHPEIKTLLGKLKFRYSYAQNVYNHSLEVGYISGIIAVELGLDQKLARRAGLLHDIGKAVDQDMEGTHSEIGYNIARRLNEDEAVLSAIREHHQDNPGNIYAVIVQAADALSAARPGARREIYESYIKRIEELEAIANSFEEVEKSYAIQAGREIRVIVNPQRISDDGCLYLAKEIAQKIEKNLKYPGEIKIVVIREKRTVDYAK